MSIVGEAAAGYAEAGYFTVVEGILIPGWFLEPVRDGLREAGHDVACAILRAPLSSCLSRVREREGGTQFADEAVIGRLWESFADLGEFEGNSIDVEGLEPEQVAKLVERRLSDGTLSV